MKGRKIVKLRNNVNVSPSEAGRLLAMFNGPAHARAARENGKKGGRPSYGVCSPRELSRRIRAYLADKPESAKRILVSDALAYRHELIDRMKATGTLGEDQAARLVFAHPLTASVEGWRRLVLRNPGLL